MSARTIIAAPVIWFGSGGLSLMVFVLLGLLVFASGNKKGPREAHAPRPNVGGRQPPPAVRLGTTTIRSLVIILRIGGARLPKGCAIHNGQTGKVKPSRPKSAIWRA